MCPEQSNITSFDLRASATSYEVLSSSFDLKRQSAS